MPAQRYVLCPGSVRSKNDGDVHFISAGRLAQLYEVPMAECLVLDGSKPNSLRGMNEADFICLRPRYHGDYTEHLRALLAAEGEDT